MSIIAKSDSPQTHIQLFGKTTIFRDGIPAATLRSRGARLLLAYLLLQPENVTELKNGETDESERSVSFNILREKIWPQGCEESNLRHRLRELRALLGEDLFIQHSRSQIRLDRTRLTVDVLEFEKLLSQSHPDYAQAVELYHGDLLPEDDLEWVVEARERLKKGYQQALALLFFCAEAERNREAQEKYLIQLASTNPVNSRWQSALMKFYIGRKNTAAARKVYQKYLKAIPEDASPDVEIKRQADSMNRGGKEDEKRPPEIPGEQSHKLPHWYGFPEHLDKIIGREEEMQAIYSAFSLTNLVTLTGPPGIGKTLLALHAAAKMQQDYADGGAFVDLAAANTNDQMLRKVAYAVDASIPRDANEERLQAAILHNLRLKSFLLVLDNCEHLLEPVSNLAKGLLWKCDRLSILATSQSVLRSIRSEREIELYPLSVPDEPGQRRLSPTLIQQLARNPAVALFLCKASGVLPDFTLTDDNAWAVASLCRLMDGLPLAINIAAGLFNEKSLEEILDLLRGERKILDVQYTSLSVRYRTLRAALDTSCSLLAPEIASQFVSLAVFQGGWTLEAAKEVLGEKAEDSLAQLQIRSLVTRSPADGERSALRFRLLESIHRFCADHLEGNEEERTFRTRHLRYYTHLAERLEPDMAGPDQERALAQLESERDNIDSAFAWAANSGNREYGLRLAGAVWRFWYVRGVGKEELERLYLLLASFSAVNDVYANALRAAGNLAFQRRDLPRAQSLYTEQLAAYEAMRDQRGMASALGSLGNVASLLDEIDTAEDHYCRSMVIFRSLGEISLLARTLDNLAIIAYKKKDYVAARKLHRESIVYFRELGDAHNTAVALNNLVATEEKLENYVEAVQILRESLAASLALEDRHNLMYCLLAHFFLAVKLGLYERAALLLGANDVYRDNFGAPLHPSAVTEYHANAEIIRLHLRDKTFDELVSKGREMELNAVLECVWEAFDRVLDPNAFKPYLEL